MLLSVVQHRDEETGSLLAVTSVTANVSVTTSTGIRIGFGDQENYSGSLVPFRAGTVYEENPNISYAPAVGAAYARRVFTPFPLAMLAQMTGTLADPAYVYEALVASVNGIRNPDFRFSAADPDPCFSRFVALMTTLNQANRFHWIENPGQPRGFSILINRHVPAFTAEVRELLGLLGLRASMAHFARVVLPVFLAADARASQGLAMITRSVGDLIEMLSAAIDVPEEDLRSGAASTYPPLGLAGRGLCR
jgi:hypothetical protein